MAQLLDRDQIEALRKKYPRQKIGKIDAPKIEGDSVSRADAEGEQLHRAKLYERAQALGIEGRSKMSAEELQSAIEQAESDQQKAE